MERENSNEIEIIEDSSFSKLLTSEWKRGAYILPEEKKLREGIYAEENSTNDKWYLSKICGIYLCELGNVLIVCEIFLCELKNILTLCKI